MLKFFHAPLARNRQRGVTLVEALVAMLVMSFGMIALVGLMSNLRRGADLAKQRSEAMRIARSQIAQMRSYSVLTRDASTDPKAVAYDEIVVDQTKVTSITPDDSNTTYEVQNIVKALPEVNNAQLVRVTVGWKDRAGDSQFVNLDTIVSAVDPVFSAVVGFTPQAAPVTQPSGRNAAIPDTAKKLDKNTSAFKPSGTSDRIWVFNNRTGVISSVCTLASGVSFDLATASDLTGCTATTGYLLSGTVRFSNTNPARPGGTAGAPEATALPLDLTLVGGGFTVPTVKLDNSGATVTGSITLTSVTAPTNAQSLATNTFYCFNDYANAAQSFVNYNCIVTPKAGSTSSPYSSTSPGPRLWSGQLQLTGPSTGTTATQYRVCRFSADYSGNGGNLLADGATLDNQEHPLVYVDVTGSLARQNFLVIRGDVSCPTASAVDPANGIFADYTTAQLQP